MLSVKNSSPDPSCCFDSSQLKDFSDERDSDHELTLPDLDLSNPPLLGETQLPNFSIRDYAFTSRSKDIGNNWPFSLKNLQLCFKRGVKDPLPPFQHVDAVRNQSSRKFTFDDENISQTVYREHSRTDGHATLDSSNNTTVLKEKLEDTCLINKISSCRSEGDNDFPSTVTSVSHSEIEESVPTNRLGGSLVATDTMVEDDAAAAGSLATHKLETRTRLLGKKCRLVVKFGDHPDRSAVDSINVTEKMASKKCPVCKTFSSSSNTTLNAHIDQCLSVESSPKWTLDSKMRRHRIKPRKTKSMVDIYATSSHCTLVDLDRRNGSNWAAITSFPTQVNEKHEMPVEEKKQRVSPFCSDKKVDNGAVYIDTNGTKLRILSKSDDVPSVLPSVSKVLDSIQPSKPLKGGKRSKFFLSRKERKHHASKYKKNLRLGCESRKLYSPKGHSSQIFGGQARHYGAKKIYEVEHQTEKRGNPGNFGALREWVCSKRTGFANKFRNKVSSQPSQCKWSMSQELEVSNGQSSLHSSHMRLSSGREVTKMSTSPIFSPGDSVGTESVSYQTQESDKEEQFPGGKRVGSTLSRPRTRGDVKRSLPVMKQNGHHMTEDNSSVKGYQVLEIPDSTGISDPLSRHKISGFVLGPNAPDFPHVIKKLSRSCHGSRSRTARSRTMIVSPLRKNTMSIGSHMIESKSNVISKCSSLKKSDVHLMEGIDVQEVVLGNFAADQSCDFMHNRAENQYDSEDIRDEVSGSSDEDSKENAEVVSASVRKEVVTWKSLQSEAHCHPNNVAKKLSSSVSLEKIDSVRPECKGVRSYMNVIVAQPSYEAPSEDITTSLHKDLNPELNKLNHHSMNHSNTLHYAGPLSKAEGSRNPTEPNFFTGQGIFSCDEGTGILVQNVPNEEELESEVGQGSSFPEEDLIYTPGPLGSFFRSCRDAVSEDFQGKPSTTIRAQSPQAQQDYVDRDSSDSPVSAISTMSNSAASRYVMPSNPKSTLGHQLDENKVGSTFSDASFDSSVENTLVPRTTCTATQCLTFEKREVGVANNMPLSFKTDDKPCCSQRKEITSQMSSYQTSKSEKMVLPVLTCRGSPSDSDSISPSSTNSVLRLMGKNLMVVNRDEDEQAQSHPQTNHLTSSHFPTFSGITSIHIQNQVNHSYQPKFRVSVMSSQDSSSKVGGRVETSFSDCSRSHLNVKASQMFSQEPECLFPNLRRDGKLTAHEDPQEYKVDLSILAHRDKSMNISSAASTCRIDRTQAIPTCSYKNLLSATNPNKENITIDNFPEHRDQLNGDVTSYYGGLGESHVNSTSIYIPTFNLNHVNPFSFNQPQDYPHISESPVEHANIFYALANTQTKASPHRSSRTTEGSTLLQQRSFLAASSPAGHVRSSTLYNSPTAL